MATRLKYNVGITINLGDYQSARVDIGIEKDVDNLDAMRELKSWCDRQLTEKVKQIREDNDVK